MPKKVKKTSTDVKKKFISALNKNDPSAQLIAKSYLVEMTKTLNKIASIEVPSAENNALPKEKQLAEKMLDKVATTWNTSLSPWLDQHQDVGIKYRVELLISTKGWGKESRYVMFDSKEDAEKYMELVNSRSWFNTPEYYTQAIGIDVART